jgi:hypothetical protein
MTSIRHPLRPRAPLPLENLPVTVPALSPRGLDCKNMSIFFILQNPTQKIKF